MGESGAAGQMLAIATVKTGTSLDRTTDQFTQAIREAETKASNSLAEGKEVLRAAAEKGDQKQDGR